MSIYTIICLLSLASCAWGSCSVDPTAAKIDITVHGTMMLYCNYRGIKLATMSSVKTMDTCQECTCSPRGLECCGYGFHAGVVAPPSGCKAVSDACKLLFVDAKDETKPCP